jgi:hypothetical protein
MPNLPESVLALFAGHDRAAAIMGDLTEMAQTRGRGWFVAAYVRTLFALRWRTVAAFAVTYAYVHSVWVFRATYSSMHLLFRWVPYAGYAYRPPVWWFYLRPFESVFTGLYVLAPFLLVRFGLRDRLTQLTFVLFLLSLPDYSNRLLLAVPLEAFLAAAFFVALCLRPWRRPMVVLTLSLLPRYAILEALQNSYQLGHHRLSGNTVEFFQSMSFVVTAVLCLWLHHWLLQRPNPTIPVSLAGGAYAEPA